MDRREFLKQGALGTFSLTKPWEAWLKAQGAETQRGAPPREPIPEPHFPDRMHLFVWRNWELANADRMAKVLGTTPEKVLDVGASMGLPTKPHLGDEQLRRIYITVIRQNWHVLPDDQLIQLLGWDRARYEYTLKEDDFLAVKLGVLKPHCEPLNYEEPSETARRRAAEISRVIRETFGSSFNEPGEPAFQFVSDLSNPPLSSRRMIPGPCPDGDVDLRQGWVLSGVTEGVGAPLALLESLQAYLREVFGCEATIAEKENSGSKVLRISVNPALSPRSGSFDVAVQPHAIHVLGTDLAGVRQALYFLQDQMEEKQGPYLSIGSTRRTTRLDPRYVYSYFALYGDPLMEKAIDPFPAGFLDRLARAGVNGVWLQAVLRNLAPSNLFPEFGEGWETRLATLSKLVERASQYGVRVFLYLNEPRSMPTEFFAARPEIRGTDDTEAPGSFAMCTSAPMVREWLSESLAHVFSRVPGLGGVFCITMSENLTNCFSHGRARYCPRCSMRQGAEVVAEVIQTFRDGVRRSSSEAEVIAWDWGWGEDWVRNGADAAEVIRRLPQDVSLLSVSEWNVPIRRGGHQTKVGEYSISVVGPGPRAGRHWDLAQRKGLSTLAKVQWANTWEISAVPYIPVPHLIAEHCKNLLRAGIRGVMASWTVGGYPALNFEVAKEFYFSPALETDEVLRRVAVRRYGRDAAPEVVEAWKAFSQAFVEFPMEGGGVVYTIPTQHGPANLLRLNPTGYKAGMMLFPHDDYRAWVGSYPVDVVEKQFEKMANLWETGVSRFRKALSKVLAYRQRAAQKDLGIAESCYLHFRSVANQVQFYRLREGLQEASQNEHRSIRARMIKIAEEEIQLAKRQYAIARRDSTIAYEASNHYYYRPLDLVEKVLNCRQVMEGLKKESDLARVRSRHLNEGGLP